MSAKFGGASSLALAPAQSARCLEGGEKGILLCSSGGAVLRPAAR